MNKTFLSALLAVGLLSTTARAWDLLAGTASAIRERQMSVIKCEKDWTELWEKHASGQQRPPVDFTKEMLVAVFSGEQATGGYKVRVSVMPDPLDSTRLYVLYREIPPVKGAMNLQVVSRPYAIRKVSKAYREVAFERDQVVRAADLPEQGAAAQGAPRENLAVQKWLKALEANPGFFTP